MHGCGDERDWRPVAGRDLLSCWREYASTAALAAPLCLDISRDGTLARRATAAYARSDSATAEAGVWGIVGVVPEVDVLLD